MSFEKIVAVDDDPRSLESLRLVLGKQYELVCFKSGEEALEYLRAPNSIQLVMVDVVMKGIDGIAVLRAIKQMNKGVAVIVMTGFGTKDLIVQALQNHADDFIEKPFDIEVLREKVGNVFKSGVQGLQDNEAVLTRMRSFVARNMSDVRLKDVAGELCLSEKYVSRLFKKKNGGSFRDHMIGLKITRAKELLSTSKEQVYVIAEMLGYQNPETFMRMFKRKVGMTPMEYRIKSRGIASG